METTEKLLQKIKTKILSDKEFFAVLSLLILAMIVSNIREKLIEYNAPVIVKYVITIVSALFCLFAFVFPIIGECADFRNKPSSSLLKFLSISIVIIFAIGIAASILLVLL